VAVVFIFITVMLDMLALGMIIPVLPVLIEDFRGGDTAWAARTVGIFGATFALMQLFVSPVLGALSDRYGRRPVILLSNFGLGFDYLLMAVAPSVSWLFVGRLLAGVTSASIPTAYAYIADVTPPERRARAYGLLGAAFASRVVSRLVFGLEPRDPATLAAAASLLALTAMLAGYFPARRASRVDPVRALRTE